VLIENLAKNQCLMIFFDEIIATSSFMGVVQAFLSSHKCKILPKKNVDLGFIV
jgi:hypothetical protein